ncbi:MAG: short-chain dehydrogenase [Robiginitomaculum sp.]|nr:MAG: short-chain dehydrogenase [Robiginitomaculum sp.]
MSYTINTLLDLSGRTALVTGASGGIGCEIARALSLAGAAVVLHYQSNKDSAQTLANELGGTIVQADLTDESAVKNMIAELAAQGNLPDLLVNNAGIYLFGSIREADAQVWKDTNAINLEGVYALTKHFANALIAENKHGAIVNIASISGIDPSQDGAHYAASKAALLSYTRASALELGEHGIRVNAVSPGLIYRESLKDQWPEGIVTWENRAPLTRIGQPEDVAKAVLFLLSPAAEWISGNNLVVDGGMGAQNRW